MISIQFDRVGLIVVASTVDDNRTVFIALGLTQRSAERRLLKTLG